MALIYDTEAGEYRNSARTDASIAPQCAESVPAMPIREGIEALQKQAEFLRQYADDLLQALAPVMYHGPVDCGLPEPVKRPGSDTSQGLLAVFNTLKLVEHRLRLINESFIG